MGEKAQLKPQNSSFESSGVQYTVHQNEPTPFTTHPGIYSLTVRFPVNWTKQCLDRDPPILGLGNAKYVQINTSQKDQ